MSWWLYAAGIYNIAWGTWVVLFPLAFFQWAGMESPNYPEIWQCVGMVVGVYGVGYWIAARNPFRHWPVVLVGFLGKLLGPIGFVQAARQGSLPWRFGLLNLT
ncbi:MAG: alkyl hydroperoxide reductase, partial [Pyrinomonadaceae bacterium]|nr:alkyl hydroperoxide reductase [Pyrinomonadaceae bacterium]